MFLKNTVLRIRILDPVPFWPQDPGSGKGKKSGSGSWKYNPDHISESLETIFRVKILKFFVADPGWKKKFETWIRDKNLESATLKK